MEVDWRDASADQRLIEISDATNNNKIGFYNSSGGSLTMIVRANNVTLVSQGASSSGFSGIQKIALAYADSDFELYQNGSSFDDSTSGSLAALATLTDVDLGQAYNAGAQANMWIRAVALFTRRLSDAEAEALTTL